MTSRYLLAIDAGTGSCRAVLFTEAALFSSVDQRAGRCNRAGEFPEGANLLWAPPPFGRGQCAPYEQEDVETAVEARGSELVYISSGCIRATGSSLPVRLGVIVRDLAHVIAEARPTEVAVERVFVNVNPNSTLLLGQARGAAIAAAVLAGLPVTEYTAGQVKQAVVGAGVGHQQGRVGVDDHPAEGVGDRRAGLAGHHPAVGADQRDLGAGGAQLMGGGPGQAVQRLAARAGEQAALVQPPQARRVVKTPLPHSSASEGKAEGLDGRRRSRVLSATESVEGWPGKCPILRLETV